MDISVRDLRTMYNKSLILWKGTPCLVSEIREDYQFTLFDLKLQKYKSVKWIPDNFVPPSVRIGYINLGTNCVYMHRIPIRRYKIGLNFENVEMIRQEHLLSPVEAEKAENIRYKMEDVSLYKALVGEYPSLEEAYEEAKTNKGTVAFDKQFAVGYEGTIYYKGKTVGVMDNNSIVFQESYSHLNKALLTR